MKLGIDGKIALVTGASKGIGRAIALALATEGARVVVVARNRDAISAAAADLPGGLDQHAAIPLDLLEPGAPEKLVAEVRRLVGDPEIVVHNLGGSMGVGQAMSSTEDWARVWHFNVGISHSLNRAFLPVMAARQWGRVVHLSTLSTHTHNGAAAYVSAKCAVDGYVKAVNREFSKDNVVISAVAPGAIYSAGRFLAKLQDSDLAGITEYCKHHLPINRLGTAEEVAGVVAFLCSDYASFMSGSIVGVDGGGM